MELEDEIKELFCLLLPLTWTISLEPSGSEGHSLQTTDIVLLHHLMPQEEKGLYQGPTASSVADTGEEGRT